MRDGGSWRERDKQSSQCWQEGKRSKVCVEMGTLMDGQTGHQLHQEGSRRRWLQMKVGL